MNAGLFEATLSIGEKGGGGGWGEQCKFDSLFILQEELIQCQCNFIHLLNNLFRLGSMLYAIICDIISLLATKKCWQIRKLMNLVNIGGENLHIS